MIDYRNILRLHSEGHSQRAIERELYGSRHTISDVLDKAKKAGIDYSALVEHLRRLKLNSVVGEN